MAERGGDGRSGPEPGLCGTCRYSRLVATKRGSTYRLCERSATDRRFPRYPALPVMRCAGYQPPDPAATRPA
jgi:hypothetical protein